MADDQRRDELVGALNREMQASSVETVLFHQAVADRLGINLTDLKCINILQLEGPSTAGRLAERTGLTTGAVTGVVDRLEKAQFVERVADPNDRRRVILRLLTRRDAELTALFAATTRPMAELYTRFEEEALESILAFTQGANAALRAGSHQLRHPSGPPTADPTPGSFAAPLGGVTRGRLEFSRGAWMLQIDGQQGMSELYRAHFDGLVPTVRVDGGTVQVQYRRPTLAEAARWALGGGRHTTQVTLNGAIPWAIDVRGGLMQMSGDFSAVPLLGIDVAGGANEVDLKLPAPDGTVRISLGGGANKLTLHRPAGVPVRLVVSGGANKLRFDDQALGSVGGEVVLASPGWEGARDRYEIRLAGGASTLTID